MSKSHFSKGVLFILLLMLVVILAFTLIACNNKQSDSQIAPENPIAPDDYAGPDDPAIPDSPIVPDETFLSDGIVYSLNSAGTYDISGYTGNATNLLIPASYQNIAVVAIKENAFLNCSAKKIYISDGIKEIKTNAFSHCQSLETIVIPSSVEHIEAGALDSCISVKDLTLPFIGESATNVDEQLSQSMGYIFGETYFEDSIKVYSYYRGNEYRAFYVPLTLRKVRVNGGSVRTRAFSGCKQINTVILSDISGSIGDYAFWGCKDLESVYLSGATGEIGLCAFQECKSLKSVFVPKGIERIGSGAFNGCLNLESIVLPKTITTLESGVLAYCPKLESIHFNGTLKDWCQINLSTFRDCDTDSSETTDRAKFYIQGKEIAGDIVIPDGITEIKDYTFLSCHDITSVTIPSGVVYIGQGAFCSCERLQTIHIPNTVQTIGYSAFFYCHSLKNLSIPASVTTIAQSFFECYDLSSINVDEQNEKYYSQDNCLIDSTTKTLLLACDNSTISNSLDIDTIETYAFSSCDSLKSIDLPDYISEINWGAFYGCTGLETITLPTSLTSIGRSLFKDCTSLKSITLPTPQIGMHAFDGCTALETVTFSPSTDMIISGGIQQSAFANCSALKSISLPKYTKKIDYSAFQDCSSLTQVEFDDELETIESYAFLGCTSLTSIVIPANVKTINDNAFADCSGLETIVVDAQNTTYRSENNCIIKGRSIILGCKNSVIPEDRVATIAENAFRGCAGLTQINIPSNIKNISPIAFYNCQNLTSIVVDSDNPNFYSEGNCIVSKTLNQIVLGCSNSTIPTDEDITTIGQSAFTNCENLTEIIIPSNITKIMLGAFQQTGLVSLVIPDSVEEIQSLAFSFCEDLETITIPNGITMLGSDILYQCNSLKTINFNGTIEEWKAIQDRFVNEDVVGYTVNCTDGKITR